MRWLTLVVLILSVGCTADTMDEPMAFPGCPPDGPYGNEPGDTTPDITLYECDGTTVQLRDLCGVEVSRVYAFAEWCPPCREHLRSEIKNEHNTWSALGDFETWIVMTETVSRARPTPGDCFRTKEMYGLHDIPGLRVLHDRSGATASELGMRPNLTSLVMSRRNRVELNGPYGASTVDRSVRGAFGPATP